MCVVCVCVCVYGCVRVGVCGLCGCVWVCVSVCVGASIVTSMKETCCIFVLHNFFHYRSYSIF